MNELVNIENSDNLIPVLPLRDVVVYPHMVIPLFVGRAKSIEAIDAAMNEDKQLLLVAQKNSDVDEPGFDELYQAGTLANVLQLLKLPDGTVKVLVEGSQRCKVTKYQEFNGYYAATVSEISSQLEISEQEQEVLQRTTISSFEQYVKLNNKIPPEVITSLAGIEDLSRLADTIAAHMTLKVEEKQAMLEMEDIATRLESLMTLMEGKSDLLEMEKRIRGRVKKQMEKNQREYYLNEQMKAIQKELGDMDDATNEIDELEKKIKVAGMSKEAKSKVDAEVNKLKLMSPMSAEASVVRNYIDWMINVPWKKKTKVRHDLKVASEVL
ncbi:MAG: LON peptidase substrate-binding domain-containing protein, partial [Methylococcales bacterium]